MKNNIFKYIFFIFIITIAIFTFYIINNQKQNKQNANTSIEKNQEEDKKEQVLNVGIVGFDTMNPILSNNKYVQNISKIIYEPLININENYELEGCIAKEWAKTSATEYVIRLKENVKWSNGENCTAEDVIYTIDRIKEITSPNIYIYNIQNVVQAETIDTYTIKITLSQEIPFFEYNLNFPIMSKSYFGTENFQDSVKTNLPMGTGKYTITNRQDAKIILSKNETYWDKENKNPQIQTIKINLYDSVGEMYNDFKLGKLDLVNTSNINIENYIGTIGYNKVETIGREYDYLAFNMENKVLSNPEVRQAINYAIDKNAIISSIYNGKYTSADFPLPNTNWLYQGNNENKYNAELAKQTLQNNGWEFKYNYWQKYVNYYTRKLNFKLVVNASNQVRVRIAEMIKQQLEAIGIKVTVVQATDNQYNNYKINKNYDMILCGTNIGISPDLSRYFWDGNLANFNNEEAKTIINDLKNITDQELLKQKYKRLYEIYTAENPYISLYHSYDVTAYSKSLAGSISANWYNMFENIETWGKK